MHLSAAFAAIALKLQEATTLLSSDDIARRLSDAIRAAYKSTDYWAYMITYYGDDESGDVVFSVSGDLKKAPYTCSKGGATVDTANAVDVVPFTTYEVEGTALLEAGKRNSSRDLAQLQQIHDHSVGLGATCKATESHRAPLIPQGGGAPIKLAEATAFPVDVQLREAFGDKKLFKLIAPGKGSTAFYTPECLKAAAAAGVFKAGTPMRADHPTAAQEAERPEGSVRDWIAVMGQDAYWLEGAQAPAGDGLYSTLKPFSESQNFIEERAPYAGVSIAAWGEPLKENGKIVTREGVPVLAKLTSADGVDMVTRAGAGGLFLTEAAKPANPNPGDVMDATEVQKLIEAALTKQAAATAPLNTKLLERAIRGDAREAATTILKTSTLVDVAKARVIESVTADYAAIPQTDGVLDLAKFTTLVQEAEKREGVYVAGLTGSGQVRGMGTTPAPAIDAKESERRAEAGKKLHESAVRNFVEMGQSPEAAKRSADRMLYGEVA